MQAVKLKIENFYVVLFLLCNFISIEARTGLILWNRFSQMEAFVFSFSTEKQSSKFSRMFS